MKSKSQISVGDKMGIQPSTILALLPAYKMSNKLQWWVQMTAVNTQQARLMT